MKNYSAILCFTFVFLFFCCSCTVDSNDAAGTTPDVMDDVHLAIVQDGAGNVSGARVQETDDEQHFQQTLEPSPPPISAWEPEILPTYERVRAEVVDVVDGDTIKVQLNGEILTVRYIGIDTPETVHPDKDVEWMGQEACEANRALVTDQLVYLEKDVSETDHYDRLLRYVYLTDGTFVNAELVRLGFAHVVSYPPDVRWQDLFLVLQNEAREEGRGLWSPIAGGIDSGTETCVCLSNLYDCKDFFSQDEAQECFDNCVAAGVGDVHHLDGDSNGVVCEDLP